MKPYDLLIGQAIFGDYGKLGTTNHGLGHKL